MAETGGAPTKPTETGLAARRAAYAAIRRVHVDDAWSPPAVAAALRRSQLDARNRAFAASLAYETLRWEGTLDWALGHALRRPLDDVEPALLDVLRVGAWQLLRSGVPARAAVATSVELARAEVGDRTTGFVNGVLRGLARRLDDGGLPWPAGDEGTALRLGYPTWILVEARARFGERAQACLEAGNRPPGLTLRAVGDRAALIDELTAAGYEATAGRRAPEAVRVPGADPSRLAAVGEGRATAQDEASMLVAHAVVEGHAGPDGRVPAGWRVLDACAGPGGKATHLAELGGQVTAADARPARARLVTAAAARLGLADQVCVLVADATVPPWRAGVFSAALVDVPCSGLGVVRRRPELRWRRTPQDPERLGGLQLRLLEGSASAVAPGGRLVYSACTWTRAETVAVAQAFLAAHGDAFAPDAPAGLGTNPDPPDPGVQLGVDDDLDGMYVARFRRFS